MSSFSLPFWVVYDRRSQSPPKHEPCDSPHSIHAFSTTQRLADFLDSHGRRNWTVSLVAGPEDIVLAVADAHGNGAASLCFDAETDGSGGKLVSLVELIAAGDRI